VVLVSRVGFFPTGSITSGKQGNGKEGGSAGSPACCGKCRFFFLILPLFIAAIGFFIQWRKQTPKD